MDSAAHKGLLSVRQVFWIWLPLAATWWLMSGEGPLANALVARMSDPRINLAALGVALSFTMLFEAPMLLILSASITLVSGYPDYLRLRRFTIVASGGLTALLALAFSPAVFGVICRSVLDLTGEVAEQARLAGYLCLPIPLSVAYRRFYQGLLIKHGLASRVAVGTVARFLTMALSAFLFYLTDAMPGASAGALALSLGMLIEAVVAREFAAPVVRKLEEALPYRPALSYSEIFRFYLPLAANSVIFMALQPLLTFFLSHSVRPIDSLAVFPVVWGCIFFFVSQGISLQEIVLSQIGDKHQNWKVLQVFTLRLGAVMALMLGAIFFTPFAATLYTTVLGLSAELAQLAHPAAMILAAMPFFTLLGGWLRALHMQRRRTVPITVSSAMEVFLAAGAMWGMLKFSNQPGAVLAPAALLLGRFAAVAWLYRSYIRNGRKSD